MIWLLALAAFFAIALTWLFWSANHSPIQDPEPSQWDIRDNEY